MPAAGAEPGRGTGAAAAVERPAPRVGGGSAMLPCEDVAGGVKHEHER